MRYSEILRKMNLALNCNPTSSMFISNIISYREAKYQNPIHLQSANSINIVPCLLIINLVISNIWECKILLHIIKWAVMSTFQSEFLIWKKRDKNFIKYLNASDRTRRLVFEDCWSLKEKLSKWDLKILLRGLLSTFCKDKPILWV